MWAGSLTLRACWEFVCTRLFLCDATLQPFSNLPNSLTGVAVTLNQGIIRQTVHNRLLDGSLGSSALAGSFLESPALNFAQFCLRLIVLVALSSLALI